MPKNNTDLQKDYDPRYFIWTVVFLIVTGVSLVAFISLSEDSSYQDITVHKQITQKR